MGNAVETVNTATDALSAVMPFGSTILSVAKAASGEDVNAGDVGFAAMEIVPLGAVGKVAKGTTILKPLGLGSTGRTVATNLIEQLMMKEAMSNPAAGQIIQRIKPLSDPRWPGWRKMQYEHIGMDGNKTIIHYNGNWKDGILKAVDDFKFK